MTDCTVECTAIPDGFLGTDTARLRLSVVMRPCTPDPARAAPVNVDLAQWPTQIPQHFFRIWAGASKADLQPVATIPAHDGFEESLTSKITPSAQSWWSRIWGNPAHLAAYLDLLDGEDPQQKKPVVKSYDYGKLHDDAILDMQSGFAKAHMAHMARMGPSPLESRFEGLTLAAARDPNDPLVRIARSLAIARSRNMPRVAEGLLSSTSYSIGVHTAAVAEPKGFVAGAHEAMNKLYARALDPEYLGDPILDLVGTSSIAASGTANSDFEDAIKTDEELEAEPHAELSAEQKYAHTVLGTLQSHPALRKFARQLADLVIDTATLRAACKQASGNLTGLIVVELATVADPPGPTPSADALHTAFALRTDGNILFEPCPRAVFDPMKAASAQAGLPLRDGFVVPQTISSGNRFRITSIDGIAAYFARSRTTQSTNDAYFASTRVADVPSEPTGFRTRGLMLLDLGVQAAADATEKRPGEIAADRTLYAEDVVDGYRVDVVAPGDKTNPARAYPACARLVDYRALSGLDEAALAYYRTTRNDGYVAPMARTWSKKEKTGNIETTLTVSQVLTTWTGRPLGLPGPDEASTDSGIPELRLDYKFDPLRHGPILRHYGRYRFLVRARKMNGSSVAVDPNRVTEFALGSRADGNAKTLQQKPADDPGFQFGFAEKAPAPAILVNENFDPRPTPESGLRDRETPTSIRVTAANEPIGKDPDKYAKIRWLALPATGFDLAELQGQFDPHSADPAEGKRAERHARYGAYRYLEHHVDELHPEHGGFASINAENPLTLMFKQQDIVDNGKSPPHYVDATLRMLGAQLIARKATPPQALDQTAPDRDLAYFPASAPVDFEPDDVTPIRIEVSALPNDGSKSTISVGDPFTITTSRGRILKVPRLCVKVAPADTVELDLWNIRTICAFHANPAIARMHGAATATEPPHPIAQLFDPDPKAAEKRYLDLTRSFRVAALSDHVPITIEHPVAKPLKRPQLIEPLNVYRAADAESWKEKVETGSIDEKQVDTAKLFVTGKLAIDRKSTGEIWAEAFWVDPCSKNRIFRTVKPEDPNRIEQTGLYDYRKPVQFRRLFSLPALGLPQQNPGESNDDYLKRIDKIDLMLDDAAPPASGQKASRIARCLSADFDCDKHRTLAVRIVARSRFAPPPLAPAPGPTPPPPPPPPTTGDDPDAAPPEDMTNIHQTASRAACIAAVRGEHPDPGVEMIPLLATRRPPPPYVTRDKGTLYRRELRTAADGSGKELVHIYRCWLDGDWFESGDGEKLAIVCRKSQTGPLPGWAEGQVSRWGGDATSATGQRLEAVSPFTPPDVTYLLAEQIGSAEIKRATLDGGSANPGPPLEVTLACLTPEFHSGFGRWYCDIELKATGAFKVGLKLVLARFQEDAMEGRQLSTTLPIDIVMLHQPWRFDAKRKGQKVEITVTGPAYTQRAPMLAKMAGVSDGKTMEALSDLIGNTGNTSMLGLAQTPLIVAELERLDEKGQGPMPVITAGRAVATSNLGVAAEGIYETLSNVPMKPLLRRWTMTLDIPSEHSKKPLAVRIGLASAHANSHARQLHSAAADSAPQASDGRRYQPSALDGPMVLLPEPIVITLRV